MSGLVHLVRRFPILTEILTGGLRGDFLRQIARRLNNDLFAVFQRVSLSGGPNSGLTVNLHAMLAVHRLERVCFRHPDPLSESRLWWHQLTGLTVEGQNP